MCVSECVCECASVGVCECKAGLEVALVRLKLLSIA